MRPVKRSDRGVRRTAAGFAAGAGLAASALLVSAVPAQAYEPDPAVSGFTPATDDCPCQFDDEIDGTNLKRDPGGLGVKLELRKDGRYKGKVEFHPYGEHLYVYDTDNDGDTFYAKVTWTDSDGHPRLLVLRAPVTSDRVDVLHKDLDIYDGTDVYIALYDDKAMDDLVYERVGGWA